MSHLTLEQLQRALTVRDPQLPQLIIQLAGQTELPTSPPREGADSFDKLLADLRSDAFRKKNYAEQWALRRQRIAALESSQAEIPLSQCLQLHQILFALYAQNDGYARQCLLTLIAEMPLVYGPWRALKSLFKQTEAYGDEALYFALAARFDAAKASKQHAVSSATLGYLVRRAWRRLRRVGQTLPAIYPDLACELLAHYRDDTNWSNTWISNHVFYHEQGEYGPTSFTFSARPSTLLKYRAFAESWLLSPRPLFALLETAQSEQVRRYACTCLRTDFRTTLRDVEPQWINRLVGVASSIIDEFIIWILDNVPRFQQQAFRELELHATVLRLFESPSANARVYASKYARTYARDMDLAELIRLLNNSHEDVRKLALDLIQARDPHKEIGLAAWGDILETSAGYQLASATLLKHFSKNELTPAWFQQRLMMPARRGFEFASQYLIRHHAIKTLSVSYFAELLTQLDYELDDVNKAVEFACQCLRQLSVSELPADTLLEMLINPYSRYYVIAWVNEGLVPPRQFGIATLKNLAYHPEFETSSWIAALRQRRHWAQQLEFCNELSKKILLWLADIRYVPVEELQRDWLMLLVQRSEKQYHDFAVDVMNRAFLPADFAPASAEQSATPVEQNSGEINVDLGGASFLFTGKLKTMTRAEAEAKVIAAGGSNASGVNKKLDWLVIGDEGSPLYGEGRKGSKQVKAEALMAEGAELKIISETAFLQMLAGEQRSFSADAVEAGCSQLWKMLTEPGKADAPLSLFVLAYIRRHHPAICLAETDRPVDPGAEIPDSFLSFERFKPLFHEPRKNLRDFALEMAKWEFARWQPAIHEIVNLCESEYPEVREFVFKALTCDESPDSKRYRIKPEVLTVDAVYSFCESQDLATRRLGMDLINRYPRLQVPQELFRLTESPDRAVCGFVIRRFWSLYRERSTTAGWKPTPPPLPELGSKSRKQAEQYAEQLGEGAPAKPEAKPADDSALHSLFRRTLFDIPSGRLSQPTSGKDEIKYRLAPLPSRIAKLNLIEVLRDFAIEDQSFAEHILPLIQEFKASKGKSEHAASLVAETRIKLAHGM